MTTKSAPEAKPQQGKTLQGVVTSTAMNNTITVAVSRYVKHPKYKKYIKRTKKYLTHAPGHEAKVGDRAIITETRPISKHKHFVLVSITKGQEPLESDTIGGVEE